jgi:hypothetical protein
MAHNSEASPSERSVIINRSLPAKIFVPSMAKCAWSASNDKYLHLHLPLSLLLVPPPPPPTLNSCDQPSRLLVPE